MNIFRVLASGKHAVREEFVSAFLAYLLSPKMDHGLGYSFLSRLLVGVAEKNDLPALKELAARMRSRLWENIFEEGMGPPVVELEFRVPENRYIDIVVKCDDWFILIENKIVQSSKTNGQLGAQYKGFLEVIGGKELFKDNRILMLYVVPAATNGESWSVSPGFYSELDNLKQRPNDAKGLVSWQPTNDEESPVSVVSIIRDILKDEANGLQSPIGTEIRYTMLSLIDFTMNEFHGFHYQHATSPAKPINPKMKVGKVLGLDGDLYIGIQYGKYGTASRAWRNPSFLDYEVVVTEDGSLGWQYLPLKTFQILTNWCLEPEKYSLEGILWTGNPLDLATLYRAGKYGKTKSMFVGIKGGLNKIREMTPEQIKARKVFLLDTKGRSREWIPIADFWRALEEKGFQFD
ncbi:MAG: PD-(D/E)XK nuclease family protein [Desulfobacteria bacterium]